MKGSTITISPEKPEDSHYSGSVRDHSLQPYFDSIISDNEILHEGFTSPDGVTRIKDGNRVAVEQTVVTAITDRRVLFTTPVSDSSGAVSLPYEKIASISVVDDTLVLQTTDGVGIEWPITADSGPSSAVCRHLCWIGEIRSRLRSCRNDCELVAGEIRTLADELAWDEALETYHETRSQLDALLNDVFCTELVSPDVLAPERTEIERTLEKAHTRLFIERGESQLELGRQLVENGDYEQGRKVLQQAQQYHRTAKQRREAVERGDAFQFGTQRTLEADIESLGWKIETVAAEPIRQAHEAKIKAQAADSPEETVTQWEQAFRRYGRVLTLEWGGEERILAGDPETLRTELAQAAQRLIDFHGQLADERWNDGVTRQEAGEHKAALRCCLDAQHHLERAHELASEFEPDRLDEIAPRLETMTDEVMRMRNAHRADEAADMPASDSGEADEHSPTVERTPAERTVETGEPESRSLPSASELTQLDTHHDITLDATELQARSADEAGSEEQKSVNEETAETGVSEPEATGEAKKH